MKLTIKDIAMGVLEEAISNAWDNIDEFLDLNDLECTEAQTEAIEAAISREAAIFRKKHQKRIDKINEL